VEPQLNVLAGAIRAQQDKVKAIQEGWRARVDASLDGQMPAILLTEMSYRDGLREAWKIMTRSEWPED
jgi:hypothetical protein